MTRAILLVALGVSFSAVACGSATGLMTGEPKSSHSGPVRLHMAEQPPPADPNQAPVSQSRAPGSFEEIAILYAEVSEPDTNLALQELQAQARDLGCTDLTQVHVAKGQKYAAAYGVCGIAR
jgi:hypothetical protein